MMKEVGEPELGDSIVSEKCFRQRVETLNWRYVINNNNNDNNNNNHIVCCTARSINCFSRKDKISREISQKTLLAIS